MSILLEALKQKNQHHAGVSPSAARVEPSVELSLQTPPEASSSGDTAEPMESLVSMLDIEPPPGLNWQLSSQSSKITSEASVPASKPEPLVTLQPSQPPSLQPLSLDLILPTPTLSPVVVADSVTVTQASTSEVLKPTNAPEPLTEAPSVMMDSLTSPLLAPRFAPMVGGEQQEKSEPVIQATTFQQEADTSITPDVATSEAFTSEPSLKAIHLPHIEKTPLSAQRFLSFARRLKPNQGSAHQADSLALAVTPKPHKPSQYQARQPLVIVGGVIVGMGVLGYATLSIWESQQQAHLQQMARYKNQSLTELPERPVVSSQPAQPIPLEPSPPELVPETSTLASVAAITTASSSGDHQASVVSRQPAVVSAKSMPISKDLSSMKVLDTTRSSSTTSAKGKDVTLYQSQPAAEWLLLAYQAYESGHWQQAEQYYRQVLEKQPRQRDALLGMLAIHQLTPSRAGAARDVAEQLRRLYPNDKEVRLATDGLVSSAQADRLSESELKQVQQQVANPSEASFRLGLLLAEQQRWSEAQSAFFESVSAVPSNPDYRLNLAISYDHLGKHRLAIEHYQHLLALVKSSSSGLDMAMVQQRLDYLLPLVMQEP